MMKKDLPTLAHPFRDLCLTVDEQEIIFPGGGFSKRKIRQFSLPAICLLPLLLCTSLLTGNTYAQQSVPVEDTLCSPWEIEEKCSDGKFLQINGISLYFEVHGQGEPLLLLHAGGGSAENFNLMLPELARHFQVITPDSRAQGRSTDAAAPLSYRQMVEDMISLLDSLEIDSAYVGGWSDGAAIALHMAIYYPHRVRALLLTPVDLYAGALTDLFWQEAKQNILPEKLELWWKTRPSPAEQELLQIRSPTLFVIGEKEQYVKLDHIAWQYQSIPGAEVVWIPEADHFFPVAKPEAVNKIFLSFLYKHR